VEPVAGPEGRLLAALGEWLFDPPRSTPFTLTALALFSLLLVLVKRLVLARSSGGRFLLRLVGRAEMGVIALFLLSMVVLSAFQILLRNVFGTGVLWIDPLLRYLTLWIGFLGAALAAAEGRHIQIDVLARALPAHFRRWTGRLVHLVAAGICAVLAESAYRHLASEHLFDSREFLELPTWILLAVIPLGLGLICYRFVDRVIAPPPAEAVPAVGVSEAGQ
jgi:TRAP-type C4-dicarboxylate transport system permease small subunit